MRPLSARTSGFTDSVIRRMTRISNKYGAINLSQGFPDFDPPHEITDRLAEIAPHGPHQYAVTSLVPPTYGFDANLLEDAFREGAKALVLCNPSNPCGKVFTREELQTIADIVIRYDGYVITDEVYEHIVYAPHRGRMSAT